MKEKSGNLKYRRLKDMRNDDRPMRGHAAKRYPYGAECVKDGNFGVKVFRVDRDYLFFALFCYICQI